MVENQPSAPYRSVTDIVRLAGTHIIVPYIQDKRPSCIRSIFYLQDIMFHLYVIG